MDKFDEAHEELKARGLVEMTFASSINNVPVRITDERWEHICRRHPEIEEENGKVLETITNPDIIQRGDRNELMALRFYEQTPLSPKYLVVVYREVSSTDGYIITAYFTNRIRRREVIWKRG